MPRLSRSRLIRWPIVSLLSMKAIIGERAWLRNLSQRTAVRDDVETIAANAQDMTEFLKKSELPELKAVETFIREIVVMPGKAVVLYKVRMSDDSHRPGGDSEELILGG